MGLMTLSIVSISFFKYYRYDIQIIKSREIWNGITNRHGDQKLDTNETILRSKSDILRYNISSVSSDINRDVITGNYSFPIIHKLPLNAALTDDGKIKYFESPDNILNTNYTRGMLCMISIPRH